MPTSTIAILTIYFGFALLELWRSNLFGKNEQTRDDGIVEVVSTVFLLAVTQPAILLTSGAIAGYVAPQWAGALANINILAAVVLLLVLDDMTQYWWHRASLLRDFAEAEPHALARPRRRPVAGGDDAVLGRGRDAAVRAVLRWATEVLGLGLDRAAYLQAAVAVGVVAGAAAAGRWVALAQARRMLVCGVLLGLMLPLAASVQSVPLAAGLLALTGAVGGLLVVPLNALLQHRGCQLLTAGRSIAVQGFNENASVLAMLAVYAALQAADVPIVPLMHGLGGAIAAGMALLWWRARFR